MAAPQNLDNWHIANTHCVVCCVWGHHRKKREICVLRRAENKCWFWFVLGLPLTKDICLWQHVEGSFCLTFFSLQTTNRTDLDENHNLAFQPWSRSFGREIRRLWFLFQLHERCWINKCTVFSWQFFLGYVWGSSFDGARLPGLCSIGCTGL